MDELRAELRAFVAGRFPGREDGLVGESCLHLRDLLRDAGAAAEWEDGPGGHDLMYWDEHLENAFRFLTGKA